MFTQSRPHQQHSMSNMYHKVQTDTGVGAASPHRLVEILFEGLFDSCSQSRGPKRAGHVEQKCRSLARAARIVDEGLKAPLDLNGGGELAKDLRDLYAYVSVRLTHANLQNDEDAVDECQRLLRPIHSAWAAIGGQVGSA
jgi:flagellar protein FliS